jgi:hypothetical protein
LDIRNLQGKLFKKEFMERKMLEVTLQTEYIDSGLKSKELSRVRWEVLLDDSQESSR